jgi:starch synthase
VPPAELSRLYSRSSLFVMPSLFEPFGLVFLEAMEHALPCIGSDRGAIPEIIEDGKSGLIAPAGDAAALAERIASLLRRPDTMRSMGECGRQRVRERFTWPRAARRADAELLEVL